MPRAAVRRRATVDFPDPDDPMIEIRFIRLVSQVEMTCWRATTVQMPTTS
jgi:hypothetical protein